MGTRPARGGDGRGRNRRRAVCCVALLLGLQAGCSITSPHESLWYDPPAAAAPVAEPSALQQAAHRTPEPSGKPAGVQPHVAPSPGAVAAPLPPPPVSPFARLTELSPEAVVDGVLARNPTLAEMVAAYRAAAARYPQVTSLDDPMFGARAAPAVWGSRDVSGGYRLELSQRFPWPGKLALRGENAAAEASAAGNDVEVTRLDLAEAALAALAEYYLVARAVEVNEENLRLLREFRQNAETRYATGQAPQQDVLQADVAIGRQKERQVTLERTREVAVARINTLTHLPPDAPLPPPPESLELGGELPGADALRALALARRPALRALADRIAAERASLALAHREYYPDVEAMAAYDAMWQEPEKRPMVGLRLNLPIRQGRRAGAVAEAQARIARRQAEYARRVDEVNFEVQQASAQVRESRRVVRLFDEEILPAAERNVRSAQTSYVTGQIPFLTLVEAQRELVALRDRYYAAVADLLRRRAALERAVGGPLLGHVSPGPDQSMRPEGRSDTPPPESRPVR